MSTDIQGLLGAEGEGLLSHVCKGIPKESLHLPGPDFVDRVVAQSDRTPRSCAACSSCMAPGGWRAPAT